MFNLLILISSVASAYLCIVNLYFTPYNGLFIIPIIYLLLHPILYRLKSISCNNIISVYVVIILLWMRMVILPMYGAISGQYYSTDTTDVGSIDTAILLIVYEAIAIYITLILSVNRQKRITPTQISLEGNTNIYNVLILISIIVFVTIGRHLDLFEFGVKSIAEDMDRVGDVVDTKTIIIRRIVSSGYLFLFMILIEKFKQQYDKKQSSKYINLSILCAILMTCIIIGERRSAQLYIAFASCWTLIRLFPKQQNKIITYIGTTAIIVLSLMTIYKQFNAFLYDSYIEAIENTSLNEGLSSSYMDAYFYGVNTIASNVSYANVAIHDISNLLYDILRSTFGISFLVKGSMPMTSEAYNMFIYAGEQSTGLLLSSVGYGYIYLGGLLAPFFSCINILIMVWMEIKMRTCRSIEMCYIWSYIFMRFAFGILGSIPPLIGVATQNLFISGGIYLIASKFFRK